MGDSYKLKDFKDNLPGILYGVYLFKTDLDRTDIFAIKNKLNRCKKKFPYISYLLIVSNTDSKHCLLRKIKTLNKKGRPPVRVIGYKVNTHIHLSVMGDEKNSAYKAVKDIQQFLNFRFKGKKSYYSSKGSREHAKNFINYCLRQGNNISKYGKFNDLLEKRKIIETKYL